MNDRIEIDVKIDKKVLNRFLLRHNYARVGGIFGVAISLAALVGLFVFWERWMATQKVVLVILALLFTVIQPCILIMKGRRQLKQAEFKIPFHYCFDKSGVTVSQNEIKQGYSWQDMRKVIRTKDTIYVYMSSMTAFIIPEDSCDGKYTELGKMIKECSGK